MLDHARRLPAASGVTEAQALRREFEFAADSFAQSSLRSALYTRLRHELQWSKELAGTAESDSRGLQAMRDHQSDVSGVRLLFSYMDAVHRAGLMLRQRLGDVINFRAQIDSHPTPTERLARLDAFHAGEHPPTSQLLRYAQSFFTEVLSYADSLDNGELAAPLKGLY